MAKKKAKQHNKIFIFLYLLFLVCLWCYFYFDRLEEVRTEAEIINKPESSFSLYNLISNFCFMGWIVTLILLIVFTINNLMANGMKALKTPAIVVGVTVLLFGIAEFCFIIAFKR